MAIFNVVRAKLCLLIAVFLSTFAVVGCSSIPLAAHEANKRAKQFAVEEDLAVLYIVQDGGYASGMALFQIGIDGQSQGSLSGWTFHRVVVSPGKHTIIATSPENEEGIQVDALAGELVFVSVPSVPGWKFMRVGSVQKLSKVEGEKLVLKANLARGFK